LSRCTLSVIIVPTPMHKTDPPLILITNDDGIESLGLRAAARAALPLGELLIVAPDRQWSGAGHSRYVDPAERCVIMHAIANLSCEA